MQSPLALQLPEVLHLIAPHLNVDSYLSSRQVCRLWNTLFTPYIAQSVDDRVRPWTDTSKPCNRNGWDANVAAANARNATRAAFIQEHKDHVRRLEIWDLWLLQTVLQSDLTQLTSLKIHGRFTQPSRGSLQDLTVPKSLFKVTSYRNPAAITFQRTRACWQVIRNNPGLQSIRFEGGTRDTLFNFVTTASGEPTAEVESFLMSTLLALPRLRHLRIGGGVDDFVMRRLPTHFPWITSFEYASLDTAGLNDLQPGYCTTIRYLSINRSTGIKEIYRVLRAFPAIESLHLVVISNKDNTPCSAQEVVHPAIKRLSLIRIGDLLPWKLCFPGVKKIQTLRMINGFDGLKAILRTFPGLEHLHAFNFRGKNDHYHPYHDDNDNERTDSGKSREVDVQLRYMVFQKHQYHRWAMACFLVRMPHLVKLELRYLSREAVAAIAQTCKNLEQLRFSVQQRCSKEIHQVLVECPNLKSLQGKGFAISVDDLLQGPDWTCFELQRLQCGIMGVPRLSIEEEGFLRSINRNPQIERDIWEEEQRILEKQRASWAVQEQVLEYLARFKDLQHLDIGFVKLPCRQHHRIRICTMDTHHHRASNIPVPDSLELSMASGLGHLETLRQLEVFGFNEVDHRIGENEMQWMGKHWSLKTVFGFGGCPVKGEQLDKSVLLLQQGMQKAVPGVIILERAV
ncbi:hypothetical protein BGX23_012792 [Mortierella sp. AD031]|nr:hypothetical protein BGX23_012792 [Mortierella sp. AD031]